MDRSSATGSLSVAAAEFGPFDGRSWFNTAHQGPLPHAAVQASERATALKAAPHRIGDDDFTEVPERLRGLLAKLVGGAPEQIVLGNSTSHGLHLIANGLAWMDGDEVLTIQGDYPATILPWQRLRDSGVRVRPLRPADGLLSLTGVVLTSPEPGEAPVVAAAATEGVGDARACERRGTVRSRSVFARTPRPRARASATT